MGKKRNQAWMTFSPEPADKPPYHYGETSRKRLKTCHPELQRLFNFLIQIYNITIISGWRSPEEQDELYRLGKSEKKGGESKHNYTLESRKPYSKAVDSAIWHPERPHIHWQDEKSAIYFAGIIKGAGDALHIPVRVGTDWDGDLDVTNNWMDAFHCELLI